MNILQYASPVSFKLLKFKQKAILKLSSKKLALPRLLFKDGALAELTFIHQASLRDYFLVKITLNWAP